MPSPFLIKATIRPKNGKSINLACSFGPSRVSCRNGEAVLRNGKTLALEDPNDHSVPLPPPPSPLPPPPSLIAAAAFPVTRALAAASLAKPTAAATLATTTLGEPSAAVASTAASLAEPAATKPSVAEPTTAVTLAATTLA